MSERWKGYSANKVEFVEGTCKQCASTNTVHAFRVDMDTTSWVDETTCGDCGTRTIEWSKPHAAQ